MYGDQGKLLISGHSALRDRGLKIFCLSRSQKQRLQRPSPPPSHQLRLPLHRRRHQHLLPRHSIIPPHQLPPTYQPLRRLQPPIPQRPAVGQLPNQVLHSTILLPCSSANKAVQLSLRWRRWAFRGQRSTEPCAPPFSTLIAP